MNVLRKIILRWGNIVKTSTIQTCSDVGNAVNLEKRRRGFPGLYQIDTVTLAGTSQTESPFYVDVVTFIKHLRGYTGYF